MDMNEALKILQNHGFKATKRRKDILQFFWKTDRYHTAKEVIEYMEADYPGVSFDTIYRNLHLYHELGILESTELNSEKHFRMNCTKGHHHHFICNKCGKAKHIDVCPMNELKGLLPNYEINDHKFEIYGLCPNCQTE